MEAALQTDVLPKVLLISAREQVRGLIKFMLESKFLFEVIDEGVIGEGVIGEVDSDHYVKLQQQYHFCAIVLDMENNHKVLKMLNELQGTNDYLPVITLIEHDLPDNYEKKPKQEFIIRESFMDDLPLAIEKYFKQDEEYTPEDFCRVSITTLNYFKGVSQDLYLQLSSGRHIKVFKEGDLITHEDIDKYKKRGVEYLHLKQKVCRWVLKETKKHIKQVLKNEDVQIDLTSEESKIIEPKNPGIENQPVVKEMEKALLLDGELKKEIDSKVKSVTSVIMKNSKLAKRLLKLQLKDPPFEYLNTHTSLLITCTCCLAKELGWESSLTFEKLIYASILHDIFLAGREDLAMMTSKEEIENSFLSDADKKLALEHPNKIGDLLKNLVQFAPPDVDLIVRHHHEFPDGSGFPNGISGGRLIPLSVLFIICHDIVRHIYENTTLDMELYLEEASEKFSSAHFNKILGLLKKNKWK